MRVEAESVHEQEVSRKGVCPQNFQMSANGKFGPPLGPPINPRAMLVLKIAALILFGLICLVIGNAGH
jgi:hypothetical protein